MAAPTAAPRAADFAQAGFTLVELLVAVTLLGFLLAALFSGLSFGARVWERSDEQASHARDLQLVHRVLSDLLGRAFPGVTEEDGELLYEFQGRSDRLRFVAFAPPYAGKGGLSKIELWVARSESRHQLRLARRTYGALAGQSAREEDDALLIESDAPLSFEYFGLLKDRSDASWHDAWNGAQAPPKLVRLATTGRYGTRAFWPELVVSVSIDMDLACVNPALVGRCRLLEVSRP